MTSPLTQRRQGLQFLAGTLLGLTSLPTAWATGAAGSTGEFERALEKLLKERPELVREALNTLERREDEARLRSDQALLRSSSKAIYAEAGSTVLGNPQGDVTLVEFIDYRCGYCRQMHADISKLLQSDRQLRVLVKHLPILGPDSLTAAQLVLSAGQGQAAQHLHQRLLSSARLDAGSLRAIKSQAGAGAVDKAGIASGLNEVRQLAERLGIDGTPALLVGEFLTRGAASPELLLAAIQTTRKQSKNPPARV